MPKTQFLAGSFNAQWSGRTGEHHRWYSPPLLLITADASHVIFHYITYGSLVRSTNHLLLINAYNCICIIIYKYIVDYYCWYLSISVNYYCSIMAEDYKCSYQPGTTRWQVHQLRAGFQVFFNLFFPKFQYGKRSSITMNGNTND